MTDDALREIIRCYTREAGVRNLERQLGKLARRAAAKLVQQDAPKRITVNGANLEEFLGVRRFSFLIANLGLDTIIAYSLPVLMFLYPLAITLILLGLCGNAFGHSRCVYGWVTGCTLAAALYDFLNALLPNYPQLAGILQPIGRVLPLSIYGLGWILPAALGLGIGLLVWVAKGKPRQRPDAAKTA